MAAVLIGRPRTCDCGKCPKCKARDRARARYQKKTDDERREWIARRNPDCSRENDRRRHQRDRAKRLAAMREYARTDAGKTARQRGNAAYRERYPDRAAAHDATSNAIRDGRLRRGPCEVCGVTEHVDGHHDDYSKPFDVRWLCRAHHLELHAAARSAVAV